MGAVVGGLFGAAGQVGSAVISSNATEQAAQDQANAAIQAANLTSQATTQAATTMSDAEKYGIDVQNQQFQTQQANIQPWMEAGRSALSGLQSMANNPAQFSFTPQDFQNNMDPAYQFDLQQGEQAVQRSAAATGRLMSGGTLKDLTNYAQGQASNEYQNAYNRAFNTFSYNQNNAFNRLASLAGVGQTATGQLSQAGTAMAGNIGNIATGTAGALGNLYTGSANAIGGYMTGAANAAGAASIAQGNIWGGAAQGIGNNLMTLSMLQGMKPSEEQIRPGSGMGSLGSNSYVDSNFTMPEFSARTSPISSLMG